MTGGGEGYKQHFSWAAVIAMMIVAQGTLRPADKRCLNEIYPVGVQRTTADFRFDRDFDGDAEGSFSCFLGMRPSELRKALDRFRTGVLYRDGQQIAAVLRFPIVAAVSNSTAVNSPVTKITIHNVSEWFAFQDKHFTKTHTALVACAYLGNVNPMAGRSPGVMIGLGSF